MSNNLNVIKAKLVAWRVLKVAVYAIGFPLLLYRLKADAGALGGYGVTAATAMTAYDIIYKCFLIMVAVQIVVGLLLRKKEFYIRALIVTIIAAASIVGPIMYMEIGIKSDFEKLEEKYNATTEGVKDYNYEFKRYELQVMNFASLASSNSSASSKFSSTYNLKGSTGGTEGGNFDRTPTTSDITSAIFLDGYEGRPHYNFGATEAPGATYSMNGLYADSYVFGFNQARYILTLYNDTKEKAKAEGRDIDAELEKALADLEKANSVWDRYKKTTDYQRAYGDTPITDEPAKDDAGKISIPGSQNKYDEYWMWAKHYYVTKEKLVTLVNKLTSDLAADYDFNQLKKTIIGILSLVGESFLGKEINDQILDLLKKDQMTYDDFIALLESLQIEIDGQVITEDTLYDLLATLSFYTAPTTYPIFYFIDDTELRDYAYAKYLGERHGAFIGSVLIGDAVGQVTMDNAGNTPMSSSELKTLFAKLDIEAEYMPKYYPWLAIRRTLIKYGGLVPVCIILAYLFAYAERRVFSRLTIIGKGGQK
ncbi:MAG: hypothetical protein LBF12_02650 [Christensenellaceae bacterium]|jgi:hypothetical protein|nr:hypothetical protein [Christensenellaceae bacterium]